MPEYRISEAAALLGVSDDTVRRWGEHGRLTLRRGANGMQVVDGIAGQADDPHPVYRAFDLPQQPGQHRIGAGLAAEEGNLDAIGQILIDQHGDVLAVLQGLREL